MTRQRTNPSVAEKIAQCMERACKNSKIGYDQYQRNTLYKAAEKVGFDVSRVTTACEMDCSALVRVCIAYAGITGLPEGFRTGNMPSNLNKTGAFTELTGSKYQSQSTYLGRGDILVTKTNGHTVCTWPHRYAMLTVVDGKLTYEAKSLSADILPEGFLEESREWFRQINLDKVRAALPDADDADRERMADFAARFNLAYFSGTYSSDDPAWTSDPGYILWQKQVDNPFWRYMDWVMREPNGDNLRWSSD